MARREAGLDTQGLPHIIYAGDATTSTVGRSARTVSRPFLLPKLLHCTMMHHQPDSSLLIAAFINYDSSVFLFFFYHTQSPRYSPRQIFM